MAEWSCSGLQIRLRRFDSDLSLQFGRNCLSFFNIFYDFMKKVVVSGGFDPVHIGHLRLFIQARKLGDHLTVILNSDNFLLNKKGFLFALSLIHI